LLTNNVWLEGFLKREPDQETYWLFTVVDGEDPENFVRPL
jgi:hypothetical protein